MSASAFLPGMDPRSVRHSIRTSLNHVVGYADILKQESADCGEAELGAGYGAIKDAALDIREAALAYFDASREPQSAPAGKSALERRIYGDLYDIISLIQTVKRKLGPGRSPRFLPDTEKILEATNGIIEIFETVLKGPTVFAEASGYPGAGRKAALDAGDTGMEELAPPRRCGTILVVDDDESNREIIARHLERQGHAVSRAQDGASALGLLEREAFDILVLDVMMPGMNGYQLLERIKADETLKAVQVIVISALDDAKGIARCIELGAEDYLPREFEPVILRARIEACLERRSALARQAVYLEALRKSVKLVDEGLSEGADYVRGLLPPRIARQGLGTDWVFIPSKALGGDVFGYHPLGGKRMALFLLDVSGHGIGAALYSVTLMNMLRNQVLADTDFADPASVLSRLNESFQMESQNNLYFTAWYGVWDERKRELCWSSAGAPPAVLLLPGGGVERLATDGMAIGFDTQAEYRNDSATLPEGARLYLFSDGIYEVTARDGSMLGLDGFIGILAAMTRGKDSPSLQALADTVRGALAYRRLPGRCIHRGGVFWLGRSNCRARTISMSIFAPARPWPPMRGGRPRPSAGPSSCPIPCLPSRTHLASPPIAKASSRQPQAVRASSPS